MTAHKHAKMIKAKADNMELVVFLNIGPEWVESKLDTMVANQDMDFFLCLPKHNDNGQCLHWLNGSDVEFRRESGDWQGEREQYHGWASYCGMMNPDVEFRIKPRKDGFYDILSSIDMEKPISEEEKTSLIYSLIEERFGSGTLFVINDAIGENK